MRAEQDKETPGDHLAMMTSMSVFKFAVSFLFNSATEAMAPWGNCFKLIVNNSTFQALQARCGEHNGVHRGQEQHVGDQGAGREDDWRVQPEEQAWDQA